MKWSLVRELYILWSMFTCSRSLVSAGVEEEYYYDFPGETTTNSPVETKSESDVILNVSQVVERIYDVVENIDTVVLPVIDLAKSIDIDIDFTLLRLTNFDEISGEIDLVAAMQVRWTAANLPEWDQDELGGKTTFSLDSSTIWTPQFLLLNPATTVKDLAATSNRLRINNNQTVSWNIMAGIEAACAVDVADFPFDKQTCDVNIAVWGYDTTEVTLHPRIRNSARDISYIESSTWSLREISVDGKNSAVNTPYFQVTLFIERHYEYFLVNVILPPTLLSVLDPCVFLLPASSGERMSFAVTCFLAFSVFMTLLGDNLPKSSVPVAHTAYFMMYMLIHSCAVTFCTIMTLRVYNKVDTAEHIPDWVKFVVRLLRLRFCRYRKPTLKTNEVEPKFDEYRPETPVNHCMISKKDSLELIDTSKPPYCVIYEKDPSVFTDEKAAKRNFWPEGSPNEPKITWYTVGRTLDAFFFVVFLGWMVFTIISLLISLQLV